MIQAPTPGQHVKLNDEGIESIGGLTSWEQIQQARDMIITDVHRVPVTDGIDLYSINVNASEINRFLITNRDVDLL